MAASRLADLVRGAMAVLIGMLHATMRAVQLFRILCLTNVVDASRFNAVEPRCLGEALPNHCRPPRPAPRPSTFPSLLLSRSFPGNLDC